MADRLVERLVTALGFAVDEKSAKKALDRAKGIGVDVAKAIGTGIATGTAALLRTLARLVRQAHRSQ